VHFVHTLFANKRIVQAMAQFRAACLNSTPHDIDDGTIRVSATLAPNDVGRKETPWNCPNLQGESSCGCCRPVAGFSDSVIGFNWGMDAGKHRKQMAGKTPIARRDALARSAPTIRQARTPRSNVELKRSLLMQDHIEKGAGDLPGRELPTRRGQPVPNLLTP